MATIFQDYEGVSGQKVNLSKSALTFGKKIPSQTQTQIHNILQIQNTGGCAKYLGLPEQFSRSKVDDFQYVVDQVKAQINPWYTQFLSSAGKEVMIKSVLQAKPVFPMSCFLLPKTICDEINSLLSEFWWGRNDGKRKISWVAWNRMCLPKTEGGMGFRNLFAFNKALLGKQAWRILQNPQSLLSRIYKGRYHRSSTFLQSMNTTQASYGWKSIQIGKELLKKGLSTLIGDGKQTNVWSDSWLPVLPPRTIDYISHDPEMKVSELICQRTNSWNDQVLESILVPGDVVLVKQIRLSRFATQDKLRNHQPIEDIRRAWEANEEWHQNIIFKNVRNLGRNIKSSCWEPPPSGWLKCNFDCSFSRDNEYTGIGWIVRDDKGCFIIAGSAMLHGIKSSLDGEAHAFLYALQNVWIKGWRQVWFEGDSLILTKIINSSGCRMEIDSLLIDIRYWMGLLPDCSLERVNRERNQAADILAKKARDEANLSESGAERSTVSAFGFSHRQGLALSFHLLYLEREQCNAHVFSQSPSSPHAIRNTIDRHMCDRLFHSLRRPQVLQQYSLSCILLC
ncbi:hypothetical protein Bca52824_068256 [Brassica carinata]|uniref:RNase H type-1 domain-containing protein n=1 Tax=Brassica carinata TaxID=52824 RepID=A0A8X7Q1Y8_BRACI|nr:hypothetical protein Bca52824_068256 [Brassica carinata]